MQLMSHVLKTNKRESVVVVFFRVSFVRDYVCTKTNSNVKGEMVEFIRIIKECLKD